MNDTNRTDVGRPAAAVRMFALTVLCAAAVFGQVKQRRSRGEGLLYCESANTGGPGSIWAQGTGIGFIWDNVTVLNVDDTANLAISVNPNYRVFLEVKSDVGITDYLSLLLESRLISYPWAGKPQFGTAVGGLKATWPNNKDLRLHGFGVLVKYVHNFVKNFGSIAGFRSGGTGFAAEGWMVQGPGMEGLLLYDLDLIALNSKLPLKVFCNLGARLPLDPVYIDYSQYLVRAGLAYTGLNVDVFVEYSLDAFFNVKSPFSESFLPKQFQFDEWGWLGSKKWEVAFSENPMYIVPGGRYRYDNGFTLFACVPLLVSVNQGSAMTREGLTGLKQNRFPEELERGITDPFDPWYAKWKVIAGMSVPLHYRQTAAEMKRTFLLMKNLKKDRKIDIDEKLKGLDAGSSGPRGAETAPVDEKEDAKKRLEEIRKRREQINTE